MSFRIKVFSLALVGVDDAVRVVRDTNAPAPPHRDTMGNFRLMENMQRCEHAE